MLSHVIHRGVPLRGSGPRKSLSVATTLVSKTLACDVSNQSVEGQYARDQHLSGTLARTINIGPSTMIACRRDTVL